MHAAPSVSALLLASLAFASSACDSDRRNPAGVAATDSEPGSQSAASASTAPTAAAPSAAAAAPSEAKGGAPGAEPNEGEGESGAEEGAAVAGADPSEGEAPNEAGEPGGGAPAYEGPMLGALYFATPVYSEPEWPSKDGKGSSKSRQIGSLRQGSRVPVNPTPVRKGNCGDGWYQLLGGGFVCGKYATVDMNHPKLRYAPHPPYMDRAMPYEHGYNTKNGTPLYGSVPSKAQRLQYEPWLAPKPKSSGGEGGEGDANLAKTAAQTDDANDSTPWYLREHKQGEKPKVTLDELRGETGGPVLKRMVRGFFLSIDKPFNSGGSRWYRTTQSVIAPADRVMLWRQPTDFHGLWTEMPAFYNEITGTGSDKTLAELDGAPKPVGANGQYAFTLSKSANKYRVTFNEEDPGKSQVESLGPTPRHSSAPLTGRSATVRGSRYDETTLGHWLKASDGVRTEPGTRPDNVQPNEKWIDIDLSTQTLVAFEGDRAVFATLVSTGKTNKSDKRQDHSTPTGQWRIREKHIAATMDGDGAGDGPYSIEDVPWIMYYQGSYALHGAFWHADFGRKKSHGCTNLAPIDAKAIFAWADPPLPQGFHAAWSTEQNPGTTVVVHE